MPINENTLEQVIIAELQKQGYECRFSQVGGLNYFSVLLNGVFPKVRLLDMIRILLFSRIVREGQSKSLPDIIYGNDVYRQADEGA